MSLDHAIVIGGSFAGLTAARVLNDHFDRVTIVERDEFPHDVAPRKGVPQSPHVHGILKLGRETLEGLLPGFVDETRRHGAVLFDQIETGAIYSPYGWSARGPSKAIGYGVRRALLEHVARRRVLALPTVEVVAGRVSGLLVGQDRHTVRGVKLSDTTTDASVLAADLVVDASGRASAAPRWLEDAGFVAPEETIVNGFVGYASRWVRVPDDAWPGDMRFIAQLPMPGNTKGGILYPQDNGLYVISLFGQARDYPPAEESAFMGFLESCRDTVAAHRRIPIRGSERHLDLTIDREPLAPLRAPRESARPVRRLGDAASCFNPIFGQGITSACLGSVMLGETIAQLEGDLDCLARVFQPLLASRLTFPWQAAIGFDLRFPETLGERGRPNPEAAEMGRYMDVLSQVGTVDVEALEAVLLATQTFDPDRLRGPHIVAKVEAWVAEGREPPNTDPTCPPLLGA